MARPYARFGAMRLGSSRLGCYQAIKKITIGGVDRTANSRFQGWYLTDTLNGTPNTLTGRVAGFVPTQGAEVIVGLGNTTDKAQRIFAGQILSATALYRFTINDPVVYDISCISYEWLLNRRTVVGRYLTTSATDIILAVMAGSTSGFTVLGVEDGLPTIDEITFTNEDVTTALDRICQRIGAVWSVDVGKDLRVLLNETDAVHAIAEVADGGSHGVNQDAGLTALVDMSEWRTRVLQEGGGVTALTTVVAGETILPVDDASWYENMGGFVVCGPQRIAYAGVDLGGGGGLVGPGAAPSSAPVVSPAAGVGVEAGSHEYAVTFVTGAGETTPSPIATIVVGEAIQATDAPSVANPTAGGGPDTGVHYYAYTFTTAAGETTPSPLGQGVQTGPVYTGGIAAPSSAPSIYATVADPGAIPAGTYKWAITYVTGAGETTPGPTASFTLGVASQVFFHFPAGPAGTIARRIYRTVKGGSQLKLRTTIPDNTTLAYEDVALDGLLGANAPTTNTTGTVTNYNQVAVGVPTGPATVTGRKLYRTIAGASGLLPFTQLKLVTTIADNTTSSYTDTTTDAGLGALVPSTNTSAGFRVAVSAIQIGAAAVTSRKIYRTAAGAAQLKLLTTIGDNTTTTYADSSADASLGANVPTSDTSGLTQPDGQVAAGSTSLITASRGAFPSAGWAIIGNGQQVIRYTGVSDTALTGIPASGPGSIVASIGYNSTVTAAPQLTGIPASGAGSILYDITKGDPVNLLVIVDDYAAQAVMAAAEGGDGIRETYLSDNRLSATEARVRATATLLELRDPLVTVKYQTRDQTTASGKDVTIAFASLQTYAEQVLLAAPLAYWRLGESAGLDSAIDATENSRPLALHGGVTFGIAGAIADGNTACSFNGTTGYFSRGYEAWMDTLSTAFTFAFVLSAATFTGTYRSLLYRGTQIIIALQDAADSLFVQVTRADGAKAFFAGPVIVGAWAWYTVTYDGRYLVVYQNGVVLDSHDCGSALDVVSAPGAGVVIGRSFGGIEYFDGSLDEAALYGRALSPTEVAAQYTARLVAQPSAINGTFKIQQVSMTLDEAPVFPLRSVEASSRRTSFDALLRLLKKAA